MRTYLMYVVSIENADKICGCPPQTGVTIIERKQLRCLRERYICFELIPDHITINEWVNIWVKKPH